MALLLRAHDRACLLAIHLLLRLALAIDEHRRRLPRDARRWRGSVRRLFSRWLDRHGLTPVLLTNSARRRSWNRTPAHLEEQIVRLHFEQPLLGAGQLRFLARRVLGFSAARETFRKILLRRRDLVCAFQQTRQRRPRRIHVSRPLALWGADLTLVFVLGFIPVWVLGVVDYRGSRLIAFEPLPWPSSAAIAGALARAMDRHGVPDRLLTDRGPVLRAPPMADLLAARGVRHVLTRPAHPWTNGRIERVFRLFKETVFSRFWLIASRAQLRRFCDDFLLWHNRDRPHGGWGGRTPDEAFFRRRVQLRPLGRVVYFDGALPWYRFG